MVPELHAAYGFSWRKAAPRPPLHPPIDALNNFLAAEAGQFVPPREPLLHLIIEQLSRRFGLPAETLLSRSREQRTAIVRHLAMHLDRWLSRQPYAVFGRHHTKVMDGCRMIELRLRRSPALQLIEQIQVAEVSSDREHHLTTPEAETGETREAERREALEQRAG